MFGLRIHRISGDSMLPTYRDGDYVISYRPFRSNSYRAGDVVLLDHKLYGRIVKRILEVQAQGVALHGDNSKSTSSDKLGIAKISSIVGKVFLSVSAPVETTNKEN